jgi:phenylalanine-4-hydroxylase
MAKPPQAPTHDAVALRGDYSRAAKDYTVPQNWDAYTDAEHALWKQLFERQSKLVERYAAPEFIAGVRALGAEANAIPRFEDANRVLAASTGWQIIAVPGLIPEENFFDHLANKRFPVTVWIRKPEEIDYLVEPDVFHDYFGHVPLLTNPIFARFMQAYGAAGPKAIALGGLKMLSRLYWYMVEFGLIRTANGLKVYGSGILSSKGETVYSIESPKPHRIGFDLIRVMRTDYLIDDYQQSYFVLESFEQLFEAGYNTDFAPIYREYASQPSYAPTTVLPSDKVL